MARDDRRAAAEPPAGARLPHHLRVGTPAGRGFDILLILSIVGSVVAVMLDSVPRVRAAAGGWLSTAEWVFTILFTIEYALRLYSSPRRLRYARSFFGIIDLLALAPTY